MGRRLVEERMETEETESLLMEAINQKLELFQRLEEMQAS